MKKRAVVFGGSGFLGSHVADALTERGFAVSIYDRRPSPYLGSEQEMIIGDILDRKGIEEAVALADVVYNFAGIADIEEANQKPIQAIEANVLGNAFVLEACKKAGVSRFVYASTLYVYSRAGCFYRSTKQASELLIESYHEAYGLPFTVLRFGSLYGPRCDERNFIYRAVAEAIANRRIVREGDGEELREYIHVLDAAQGSVEILEKEYENEYVILTGQQQLRVKDLLQTISEILGGGIDIDYVPPKTNYHYQVTPYAFSPKLAKRLVGRSYIDLGQGLLQLIQERQAKGE